MYVAMATLSLASMGGCFSPTYQEGLACSDKGECPSDLECVENVCLMPAMLGADARVNASDADPNASDAAADGSQGGDGASCASGSLTIEPTGSIVDFVVPSCVTALKIEVFGAEGGSGIDNAVLGGKGARMKGDFTVTGGDTLKVLVGMRGVNAFLIEGSIGEQAGGTGGGGTFVATSSGDAMIVAGGGGGATNVAALLWPGYDAGVGPDGQTGGGSASGVGGTAGQGGGTYGNAGYHGGTGGGGFLTAGLNSSLGDSQWGTPNGPGASFAEGGAGGIGGSKGRDGGFGGGGASGFTGGGGGGYSGGGAGGTITGDLETGGGGGGSFNAGTNPDNSAGARLGDGQVIVTW